ncbi:MAG: MFS transporter [Rhizobiaceae bacterium]|nr:MFS transporter [Rhizobiaceae bacterium]
MTTLSKIAFLIWFTYDVAVRTGMDGPTMVTLAAGLFILPFFLFSATAGQLADKLEKSQFTQRLKLIELGLMVTASVFFFFQSVYGLLLVLFMMGVQSTFFGPIKYSLLPEHLEEDELIGGNALIEAGTFLSILLGTIFGGLVVRTEYGLLILAAFLIGFSIIGWLGSRTIPVSPVSDPNVKVGWNIVRETWQITKFARQENSVWLSIIGISWFWFVGATFLTQFPVFTSDVIGGNEHIVTLFLALFSIGICVGSVLCNKLLKGEINGKLVPYGSFGMTVSIAIFVFAAYQFGVDRAAFVGPVAVTAAHELRLAEFLAIGLSSWGIMLGLLGLAISAGLYIVPLYAIMQHRSEDRILSRVIAASNVVGAFFMVIASVMVAVLYSINFTSVQVLLTVGLMNIPAFFVVRSIVNRRSKNA